jgi:hypothetical protein
MFHEGRRKMHAHFWRGKLAGKGCFEGNIKYDFEGTGLESVGWTGLA